ncbi:MAG: fluoride efflux transporter CrcB [Comamonadaceae bacterium]|nr:fluoride efflux transporter CrcB [Comamonadaceae bacterium]
MGAAVGAWLRWGLGMVLNPVFPAPLGTLAASLLGGYLMGLAMGVLAHVETLAELRLLMTTGFRAGSPLFHLLRRSHHADHAAAASWALAAVGLHVAGSLAMTLLGIVGIETIL